MLSLSPLTSGCGVYDDVKLNHDVDDYKRTCFGTFTNHCQYKLAETNIAILEHFRESVEQNKEQFIESYGNDGYHALNKIIDNLVDEQNNLSPSWLSNFILSDAQPFGTSENYLLNAADIAEIQSTLDSKFKKTITTSQKKNKIEPTTTLNSKTTTETTINESDPVTTSSNQNTTEYQAAYNCAMESFKSDYGPGPAAYCVGNSRDPSEIEEKAYNDAERDFSTM